MTVQELIRAIKSRKVSDSDVYKFVQRAEQRQKEFAQAYSYRRATNEALNRVYSDCDD